MGNRVEVVDGVPMLVKEPNPLILRRPDLTIGSLTGSFRAFFDRIPADEQPFTNVVRPDVDKVAASFHPPLNESEMAVLVRWLSYVYDPDNETTPASLAYLRATSIIHMADDVPAFVPHVDEEKRLRYFRHNNKIDVDFSTLAGTGYINEFNDLADNDPDMVAVFFHNWNEWTPGTLQNTLKIIGYSRHLHQVTHKHVDILKHHLSIATDVGVKDAIIDFCETLQLDRQFDVSWLADLDLTPTWIKEYAVKIGTQSSSLHPQKDTD